ncbi:N-acetylglucosamine-6-phosphate deacetylase [Actinoalloteichus spitiensis]|uniref:N-acetylglucosamine-6-phosphate deacetylase n=1 Tax=Actinoalloteichus spitiensis TaxID=252394 RepID=UPI0003775592|nr:N-acetylglucosamine-6-phosphate deacetylase [Actinoalloteichus spitiensis]
MGGTPSDVRGSASRASTVSTLVTGGRVITPQGVVAGWVAIDGGRITAVGEGPAPAARSVVEAAGGWVVPGFVDIHCHGGGGASFTEGTAEAVSTAVDVHRGHGTTTLQASLVSAAPEELVRQIGSLRPAVRSGLLAGIHLEGPFLAEGRCGAHDPAALRAPEPELVDRLLAAGEGTVRMVTLAPELPHALPAVRRLVEAGVLAAVGHTDATADQARAAVDAGARVATHLFNAMRPLHHREPGPIAALLDDDRVVVELICDLVHLHPTVARLAARYAGPGRTAAVTDAIGAAGAGDGQYVLGGLPVTVTGGVPLLPGGALAGSSLTMDRAFANLVRGCGLTVEEAVHATSTTPAALLGLDSSVGAVRPGLDADLVVLDEEFTVRAVLAKGTRVPPAGRSDEAAPVGHPSR